MRDEERGREGKGIKRGGRKEKEREREGIRREE